MLCAVAFGFQIAQGIGRNAPQSALPETAHLELLKQIGGGSLAVTLDNTYAYVSIGPRLVIYDTSNPAHYQQLGQTEPFDYIARASVVVEQTAFVANLEGGVQAVNITDIRAPQPLGQMTPSGLIAYDLDVVNNTAVVLDRTAREVTIFSITPSGQWQAHSTLPFTIGVEDIILIGHHLYITQQTAGIAVYDVSSPATPRQIVTLDLPGTSRGFSADGNTLAVNLANSGFALLDVNDPADPTLLGGYFGTTHVISAISLHGTTVASTSNQTLRLYDVSTPNEPIQVASAEITENPLQMVQAADQLLMASAGAGLSVINIQDVSSPQLLQTLDLTGRALDVQLHGSHAFLRGYPAAPRILDISTPLEPISAGNLTLNTFATSLAIGSDQTWLTTFDHLVAFDTTQPTANQSIASFSFNQITQAGIAITDQHVFVASGYGYHGLRIFDRNSTGALDPIGDVAFTDPVNAVITPQILVASNRAWVLDGARHLRVFDVSNVAQPVEIGRYTFKEYPGATNPPTLLGNELYIAGGYFGLAVFDVSNPAEPTLLARHDEWAVQDFTQQGRMFFSVDRDSVIVLERLDAHTFLERARDSTAGSADGIDSDGTYLYVSDQTGGLLIYRWHPIELWFPFIAH